MRHLLLSLAVVTACGTNNDRPTEPPPSPDCVTATPAQVIEASGCIDDAGEFHAVAVFTCTRGRLFGIGNRWAFAGDATWTVGGQALWDLCRPDR